jgi:hypothetical protein
LKKKLENPKLASHQTDTPAVASNLGPLKVHNDAVKTRPMYLVGPISVAQCHPNSGQKFSWTERYRHIVIGTPFEKQDDLRDVPRRTENDERD